MTKPTTIKPASSAREADPPRRWWQWLLLYPTLAVAIFSAVPTWVDKGLAFYHDFGSGSYVASEEQTELWRRNLTCTAAPFAWYSNPDNVRVDATICNSGDVFVRASTPQNAQFFKWLPLKDVLALKPEGGGVIPAAHAQEAVVRKMVAGDVTPAAIRVQYQNAVVVCQKFIDQRMLLRHVRTPQGCFDEIIDTANGRIVDRKAVPCRAQC